MGLGHSIVGTMALRAELSRDGGYPCPRPGARPYELCVTQGKGVADPFVNDSSTGRGFVLGRAATKLRSIENYPLTGGSIGQRPVPSFIGTCVVGARILFDSSSNPSDAEDYLGAKNREGRKPQVQPGFTERKKRIGGENLMIRERKFTSWLWQAISQVQGSSEERAFK